MEAAVWTPPHVQKATSMGDGAESHGRCSQWGDSTPQVCPWMLWLLPWFWESRVGSERRELLWWVSMLFLQPRGANSEEKTLSSPRDADG